MKSPVFSLFAFLLAASLSAQRNFEADRAWFRAQESEYQRWLDHEGLSTGG